MLQVKTSYPKPYNRSNLNKRPMSKFQVSVLLIFNALFATAQVNPKNITIVRDSFGVPHIFAKTDAEAAYGLAYAHCEDDFEHVQQNILAGKNMLGSVLGKEGVLFDYGLQFLGIDTFVERVYKNDLSDDFKKILQAYCKGVNDYAAKHPKDVLVRKSFPFTPKDVVKGNTLTLSLLSGVGMALKSIKDNRIEEFNAPNESGSNAMAIAPSKTDDGKTWLAINSHQPLEGRFAWYEAHVVSEEGWNIIGGLFPGGTSIFVGSTQNLGWAHTTNYNTWGDIFRLQINKKNKHEYLYDGVWKNFNEGKAKLKINLSGLKLSVKKKLQFCEYGPVFKTKKGSFAIRFPAYRDVRSGEQWYRMNKATNFKEFEKAMQMEAIPMFNVLYADKDGHIYFQSNGTYPKRNPNLNWHNPILSNTSSYKWTELLKFEEKPFILDPECGFVYNANNTPLHATGASCDWKGYFPGLQLFEYNRGERLGYFLRNHNGKFKWEDFLKYKFDKAYHPNGMYTDRFRTIYNLNESEHPKIADAIRKFKKWNLDFNTDNKDAALAMITHFYMVKEYKSPFAFMMIKEQPVPIDLAVSSIAKAKKLLLQKYGTLDLALGDVQRHIRGNVSIPASGGYEVLRAADAKLHNKKKGTFRIKGGDGYIQLVKYSKENGTEIESINAYGASANEDSKHYTDQMQMFQNEQFKKMTFKKNDIFKNAEKIYSPGELYYR